MEIQNSISRRTIITSSIFGLMAVSLPNILAANNFRKIKNDEEEGDQVFHRYPSIDDTIVNEVVGASHFNYDRVKELVNNRPELARATWDWAFGDWETALGAASHVGRRDIASILMDNGARPDIFTHAMLGDYKVVKSMIETVPGIESLEGPHGISLLRHARAGLRSDYGVTISRKQEIECKNLIGYLEKLGTADIKPEHIAMSDEEKNKYLGDYMYGEGPNDGVTVKINMRNYLALGRLGKSGGSLYQKSPNEFSYNGTSSVRVTFTFENNKVIGLTITEPDLVLKATKI